MTPQSTKKQEKKWYELPYDRIILHPEYIRMRGELNHEINKYPVRIDRSAFRKSEEEKKELAKMKADWKFVKKVLHK